MNGHSELDLWVLIKYIYSALNVIEPLIRCNNCAGFKK
jgi:hypothetical protein